MTTPLYTDQQIAAMLDEIWLADDRLLSTSLPPVRRMIEQMRDAYELNWRTAVGEYEAAAKAWHRYRADGMCCGPEIEELDVYFGTEMMEMVEVKPLAGE